MKKLIAILLLLGSQQVYTMYNFVTGLSTTPCGQIVIPCCVVTTVPCCAAYTAIQCMKCRDALFPIKPGRTTSADVPSFTMHREPVAGESFSALMARTRKKADARCKNSDASRQDAAYATHYKND